MPRPVFNRRQTFSEQPPKATGGPSRRRFGFGPFTFDPAEHRLERSGTPVPLTPRQVDLLLVLVENAGHLVAKETFLERIWPDTNVEEANLSVQVSRLRRLLAAAQAGGARYIETVPTLGYRFMAPVRTMRRPPPRGEQPRPRASHAPERNGGAEQYSGDAVRLTIELVRLRDGQTLWTESVEGVLSDPPALHDRIAEEVDEILSRLRSGSRALRPE